MEHELGHVVQQKQGRVRPSLQFNNANINNDHSLEAEATSISTIGIAVQDTVSNLKTKHSIGNETIQCRLQAKHSSWVPFLGNTFFNTVETALNSLTHPNSLAYNRTGFPYRTLHVGVNTPIANIQNPQRVRGTTLIQRIINSARTVTIYPSNENTVAIPSSSVRNETPQQRLLNAQTQGVGTDSKILFNDTIEPIRTMVPVWSNANNQARAAETPNNILLGHELGHADRMSRGVNRTGFLASFTRRINPNGQVNSAIDEEELINIGLTPTVGTAPHADPLAITENDLRTEHALDQRIGYNIHPQDA